MADGKPVAKGFKTGDNVFGILAACEDALEAAGQSDKFEGMKTRVQNSGSYEEALEIMQEFCIF